MHKMTYTSHKMVEVVIFGETNICFKKKNHTFATLFWNRGSCHLEISHMLNGTTPKNQHRNRGPKTDLEYIIVKLTLTNAHVILY